jgi:hypothetical protein
MMKKKDASRRWTRVPMIAVFTAVLVAPTAVWAADAFTDVPETNVFHDDIAWLADAAITLGCNPPENTLFCPSDTVTREQMAAFMRRLAENQVVDAADSQLLAGSEPAAYETIITGTQTDPAAGSILTSGENTAIEELTFEAPVDGWIQATAAVSYDDSGDAQIVTWLQLDNTECDNVPAEISSVGFGYASTNPRFDSVALSGVAPVAAGSHTLTLCAREFAGAFDPLYWGEALNVVFSASGSVVISSASNPAGDMPGASG